MMLHVQAACTMEDLCHELALPFFMCLFPTNLHCVKMAEPVCQAMRLSGAVECCRLPVTVIKPAAVVKSPGSAPGQMQAGPPDAALDALRVPGMPGSIYDTEQVIDIADAVNTTGKSWLAYRGSRSLACQTPAKQDAASADGCGTLSASKHTVPGPQTLTSLPLIAIRYL